MKAKVEAHEDHALEDAERRTSRAGFDRTPDGEKLRRSELGYLRTLYRSMDAFWKYRKNAERGESGGGSRKTESNNNASGDSTCDGSR